MKNIPARPDRRWKKTRRAIRAAFEDILSEKEFGGITVKNIADRADIDRKTFYAHYVGVYDLLDDVEKELLAALELLLKNAGFSRSGPDPYLFFSKLTALVDEDFRFYRSLLKTGSPGNLLQKAKAVWREKILEFLPAEKRSAGLAPATAEFAAAGAISIYQQWLDSDRAQPLEELAATIGILTRNEMERAAAAPVS